ncbi:hypothetical protein DFR29_103280 [Tahibacter aquaticus]|uniref:Uncharacterized protein n=1 Tax=Tahibacter aquaticus TaxID=520092 RepID=A0A4R6Z528_9GAMM|nr:choice-of-anchor X domain-containing protein [Tahibacter aquaticus]TDR46744.1 hypothetical protein DFR29_103280 [Tahibacter aquaticus]
MSFMKILARKNGVLLPFFSLALLFATPVVAGDPRPGEPGYQAYAPPKQNSVRHVGNSPFTPPQSSDLRYVVDTAPGLDTGCVFRDAGPLIFDIPVDRAVGNLAQLRAKGLISETVLLSMPAYDVDFTGDAGPGRFPERNRVVFNGHVVPGEFLKGANGVWRQNTFRVPVEWVRFPADPGQGGSVATELNRVEVHIDVLNTDLVWCTEIDWAALELEKAVRPVVGVHGIFSGGYIWDALWVPRLAAFGVPMTHLNLGALGGISANAAQIATHVEAVKRRWGVDRVNIVAHSKGGLDSREFVENNDSVENLLQLGTPNAGSPLADKIQASSVVLFGLGGTLVANALAGPAGYQLTTPYMYFYNRNHGPNAKVDYTAVAGDYNPDCLAINIFCRPLSRLLLSLSEAPGDTIVPVWSAHALSYTRKVPVVSRGENLDATHSGLHASAGVFSDNYRFLLEAGAGKQENAAGAGAEKSAQGSSPSMIATGTVGGEIGSGQNRTHAVAVDQRLPTLFTLLYPSGALGMSLISPSGRRIDPAVAAADPDIEYEQSDIPGGRAAVYGLLAAEAGIWTVEVAAGALGSSVAYAVQAQLQNADLVLSSPSIGEALSIGGQVVLKAAVTDAQVPVTGASVTARVRRPDATVQNFAMRDDGIAPDTVANDGIYQATVADNKLAGFQPVAFSASGVRANGAAFSREIFGLIAVSSANASFTGTLSDAGEDSNSDGLFDHLVLRAQVNAGAAGEYRIYGELTDSAGNRHEAAQVIALQAGTNVVELRFDGAAIFARAIDGPYTVAVLRLAQNTPEGAVPAAELSSAFQTAAYRYTAFQHEPIRVSGSATSAGVDSDGDRLFDLLNIHVDADIDRAGFYQWSGVLVDRNGNELGFAFGAADLVAGTNRLLFSFDAVPIGRSGVDGPYFLRDVLIFGAGANAVVDLAIPTLPFSANQFEGFAGGPVVPAVPVPLGGPFVLATIGLLLGGFGLSRLRRRQIAGTGR